MKITALLLQWLGWIGIAITVITGLALRYIYNSVNNATVLATGYISFMLLMSGIIASGFLNKRILGRIGYYERDKNPFSYWFNMIFFMFTYICFIIIGIGDLL